MAFCINCGRPLYEDSVFCEFCGTRQPQTPGAAAPPPYARQAPAQPAAPKKKKKKAGVIVLVVLLSLFLVLGLFCLYIYLYLFSDVAPDKLTGQWKISLETYVEPPEEDENGNPIPVPEDEQVIVNTASGKMRLLMDEAPPEAGYSGEDEEQNIIRTGNLEFTVGSAETDSVLTFTYESRTQRLTAEGFITGLPASFSLRIKRDALLRPTLEGTGLVGSEEIVFKASRTGRKAPVTIANYEDVAFPGYFWYAPERPISLPSLTEELEVADMERYVSGVWIYQPFTGGEARLFAFLDGQMSTAIAFPPEGGTPESFSTETWFVDGFDDWQDYLLEYGAVSCGDNTYCFHPIDDYKAVLDINGEEQLPVMWIEYR